eukprot:5178821-Pyramimonas_sp.AAC.1
MYFLALAQADTIFSKFRREEGGPWGDLWGRVPEFRLSSKEHERRIEDEGHADRASRVQESKGWNANIWRNMRGGQRGGIQAGMWRVAGRRGSGEQ